MATCEELAANLIEAEAALHTLSLGGGIVRVRYDEKETEFSRGNLADLRAYISRLKDQIRVECEGKRPRRRVIGLVPE
jgi:hypothetical protein